MNGNVATRSHAAFTAWSRDAALGLGKARPGPLREVGGTGTEGSEDEKSIGFVKLSKEESADEFKCGVLIFSFPLPVDPWVRGVLKEASSPVPATPPSTEEVEVDIGKPKLHISRRESQRSGLYVRIIAS